MMRTLLFLFISVSCSTHRKFERAEKIENIDKVLDAAEARATEKGREVLSTGRLMIKDKKIVRGSCWDYANALYSNAGFSARDRVTPLKSKFKGPYAEAESIEPGDWLYFINHSFRESDHSGIFVEWHDEEKMKGIILSYVGGKKKVPGNYRIYDLSHVYYIIRGK
jgi:hypothetical protein